MKKNRKQKLLKESKRFLSNFSKRWDSILHCMKFGDQICLHLILKHQMPPFSVLFWATQKLLSNLMPSMPRGEGTSRGGSDKRPQDKCQKSFSVGSSSFLCKICRSLFPGVFGHTLGRGKYFQESGYLRLCFPSLGVVWKMLSRDILLNHTVTALYVNTSTFS